MVAGGLLGAGCGLKPRTATVALATTAPGFSLADQSGKKRSLSQLTSEGPAVLVFYRGHW